MKKTFISSSAAETKAIAAQIAAKLKNGDIIAFEGGLGAGKTTFTDGIAAYFGITDTVQSPTFAIINEYAEGNIKIAHFDMYRIDTPEDLYSTGFYDYIDTGCIIVIEWSEKIAFALAGLPVIKIAMETTGEESREITVEGDLEL